jgi:hypothetical protein
MLNRLQGLVAYGRAALRPFLCCAGRGRPPRPAWTSPAPSPAEEEEEPAAKQASPAAEEEEPAAQQASPAADEEPAGQVPRPAGRVSRLLQRFIRQVGCTGGAPVAAFPGPSCQETASERLHVSAAPMPLRGRAPPPPSALPAVEGLPAAAPIPFAARPLCCGEGSPLER